MAPPSIKAQLGSLFVLHLEPHAFRYFPKLRNNIDQDDATMVDVRDRYACASRKR